MRVSFRERIGRIAVNPNAKTVRTVLSLADVHRVDWHTYAVHTCRIKRIRNALLPSVAVSAVLGLSSDRILCKADNWFTRLRSRKSPRFSV